MERQETIQPLRQRLQPWNYITGASSIFHSIKGWPMNCLMMDELCSATTASIKTQVNLWLWLRLVRLVRLDKRDSVPTKHDEIYGRYFLSHRGLSKCQSRYLLLFLTQCAFSSFVLLLLLVLFLSTCSSSISFPFSPTHNSVIETITIDCYFFGLFSHLFLLVCSLHVCEIGTTCNRTEVKGRTAWPHPTTATRRPNRIFWPLPTVRQPTPAARKTLFSPFCFSLRMKLDRRRG